MVRRHVIAELFGKGRVLLYQFEEVFVDTLSQLIWGLGGIGWIAESVLFKEGWDSVDTWV